MDKLKLSGIEGSASSVVLEVQFNPAEIHVDKSIPWQLQPGKAPSELKYSGGEVRTMSFELMFDGFQSGTSIQGEINKLYLMSDVDPALKRPPKVRVVWGQSGGGDLMPKFDGVIESIGVKYTMFDAGGKPLRAKVALTLKEARNVVIGKNKQAAQ